MFESLSSEERIHVDGEKVLDTINAMNAEGKFFVFAPNHLKPKSSLRTASAFAEDFPVLRQVLQEHGIRSAVVFRGDTNMPVGKEGTVTKAIYDLHRFAFSKLVRTITGGIPLNINSKNRDHAISTNASNVREMITTLQKRNNLTIFPYGNWFPSGEQSFDPATDLNPDSFVEREQGEQWNIALKSGFIRMARRTQTPIVPVYMEQNKGKWIVRFGDLIHVTDDKEDIDIGREYLASMQQLKSAQDH